jgi:hypothetical protein
VPPLLPYACDRKPQRFQLGPTLRRLKEVGRRPLICIIHGDLEQAHDGFVRWLHYELLTQLMGLDPTTVSVGYRVLPWPPAGGPVDFPDRLRESLAQEVGQQTNADVNDLARSLCANPGPFLIDASVDTEIWGANAKDLVERFLEFWRGWPDLDPGQWLIVCLSLRYREYPFGLRNLNWWRARRFRSSNAAMRGYLQRMASVPFSGALGRGRVDLVVLDELTGVERQDALDWARKTAREQYCQDRDLVPDIDELFERQAPSGTIGMRSLAPALSSLLDRRCAAPLR